MKKSTGISIAVVIVIILTIILFNFFYIRTPSSNKDITISQVGDFVLYLPLYVAQDKGFFNQEGLNVKIMSSGGDDKSFAAVLSGEAQFAQGDPTFVAVAKEKGGTGKAVAMVVNKAPFWFVSTKNITINSAKDFRGKKLVTYLAPSTAYTLTVKLAQDQGLVLNKDYTIIQSQFGSELGPLFSGEADASLTLPPTVQEAVDKGAHVVYSYPEAFGDMAVTGLTTTDKYVKNNPETVQAVVNSYQKATDFIYNNQEEATQVAIKRFSNIPQKSIRDAINLAIKDEVWPRKVAVSKSSWDKAIQIRVQVGDLKSAPIFTDVVDNTFADKASS